MLLQGLAATAGTTLQNRHQRQPDQLLLLLLALPPWHWGQALWRLPQRAAVRQGCLRSPLQQASQAVPQQL